VANLLTAIKLAKYYELMGRDLVVTISTDSMELYGSRVQELREEHGEYRETDAVKDYHRYLMAVTTDHMLELGYHDKKRIHNLKYYTWIEQQQRDLADLEAQWYEYPEYWEKIQSKADDIDRLIEAFNEKTGLLKNL
jgi:hypothetical protein